MPMTSMKKRKEASGFGVRSSTWARCARSKERMVDCTAKALGSSWRHHSARRWRKHHGKPPLQHGPELGYQWVARGRRPRQFSQNCAPGGPMSPIAGLAIALTALAGTLASTLASTLVGTLAGAADEEYPTRTVKII